MSSSPTDGTEAEGERHPTVDVTMPDTGSSSGTTVRAWLKRSGEAVDVDEPICLVSWEGMTAEVGSPAPGVLRMISVSAGTSVPAGTSLALVDTQPTPPRSSEPEMRDSDTELPVEAAIDEPASDAAPAAAVVPGPLLRDAPVTASASPDLRRFVSPAVRRFAREHGLDLERVDGTGRDGRVTLFDLQRRVS